MPGPAIGAAAKGASGALGGGSGAGAGGGSPIGNALPGSPGSGGLPRLSGPGRGGGEEGEERRRRNAKAAALAAAAAVVLALAVAAPLLVVFAGVSSEAAAGGEGTSWNFPSGSGIPPVYWPIYEAAGGYYHISPFLLASIHDQETGFSTNPTASSGINSYGCCAGPMQFNVVAGTWNAYKYAFRPIAAQRPASYPLDRRTLPSCRGIPADTGCVYDDFDAISGAAMMLHEDGADEDLSSEGTRRAVCDYIGSCSEVDACTGDANEYCEVLPRALEWERSDAEPTATTVALTSGSNARLLPDGRAADPADAPPAVDRMIAAANSISNRPYLLLHYPTVINNPTYDCSSSTSYVLWAGGKFGDVPWCSSEFTEYGEPGPGKWVTIYARGPCGPEGHVWMVIAGLRFDTSPFNDTGPNADETGPRWRTSREDVDEFVARHPPGL